ncbi:MAG: HNH endonuclease [Anaerolineae bacterium]|jgi:hypothetical protein|nr:HNH endonuclease [Anaerolineae bacterium]
MAGRDITATDLRCALDYDPLTGIFRWKVAVSSAAKVGAIAGCKHHSGYWQIRFQKNSVFAHRLAWLHYYGHYPNDQIDHLNGDRLDNRIDNLRDVTPSINLQNAKRPSKNKKSAPYRGVYKEGNSYRARISINGKSIHLGRFVTPEMAQEAYMAAKRRLHPTSTF